MTVEDKERIIAWHYTVLNDESNGDRGYFKFR